MSLMQKFDFEDVRANHLRDDSDRLREQLIGNSVPVVAPATPEQPAEVSEAA